jgi:branched-chain amino acid transport system ATP-binding protein
MILQTEDLTKRFGGLVAVDRVCFHVDEHEILGVIGPNGAGKSTLINTISGFFPPTSGKVVFRGKDITGLKAHQIAQQGLSRNFQASVLFMQLPVIENVFSSYHMSYKTGIWDRIFHLPPAREEAKGLRQKAVELLEKVGLGNVTNELTKNLPHGHQRILGVCLALATNPRLLLLDEPMTGMNQVEIQTMVNLVKWIRDSGVTIVMIEHNMEAVMSLCDRIVVLNHGQKIAEGSPKKIQENEQVIEAYLGKE